jgi:outer membrane protein assembly factor BamD
MNAMNLRHCTTPSLAPRRTGRVATVALMLALTLALGACSTAPPKVQPDRPVEELYNNGINMLGADEPTRAIEFFEEVERQHPYSVWASKAILMAAYTRYRITRFDEAIIGLDRFIRLHPGSRDIAYAYYLRALCFYEQVGDIHRDQAATLKATEALSEVVRRFPNSKYANDAKFKVDLTLDQLAGQEMAIGRWYQRRREHQAAINRFNRVIEKFQTTSHVPEALHRLTESYAALGLTEEAKRTAAVLGHNFPGSEWYVDSYALVTGKRVAGTPQEPERPGWLSRAWNTVF